MSPSDEEQHLDLSDTSTHRDGERSQTGDRELLTSDSDLDATHSNLRNASTALLGTLDRLDQIRRALRDLESDGSAGRDAREQLTRRDTPRNSDSAIRPPHSAIVLSGGNESITPTSETLRARLNEINAELPGYMRAATNLMRIMSLRTQLRAHEGGESPNESNGPSRQAAEPRLPFRRRSNGVSGWYTRPRRDSNTTPDGGVGSRRQEVTHDNISTHAPMVIRLPFRDSDSASTLLGRRVASRAAAAAASSARSSAEQTIREPRASTILRRDRNERHLGNRESSRVIVPPRLPDRVSRRIAQFESNVRERDPADSEGSETEVDDHVYRPTTPRWFSDYDSWLRSSRQRRTDTGRSPLLPQVDVPPPPRPLIPFDYGEPNTEIDSPRSVYEGRSVDMSSRMQDVYGRLDRISSALSTAQADSYSDSLNNTLMQSRDRLEEAENLYHEVIDEEEGRSYRVRRRLNANGDEVVHRISADETWWDLGRPFDPANYFDSLGSPNGISFARRRLSDPWLRNSGPVIPPPPEDFDDPNSVLDRMRRQALSPIYIGQGQRSETDLPPLGLDPPQNSSPVSRRRRAWARLDPDGDEIPFDEEEEYIGQPVRMGQSSSRSAYTTRTRLEYLAPTTRSVFSNATDDEDENSVRVRLNRASGQSPRSTVFSAFLDAKAKGMESEAETAIFGTTEPYYLYPLPQRLEDMGCLAPTDTPLLPMSAWTGRANLREPDMAAR